MPFHANDVFSFSPLHRLQWEEAQQRYVILYPEGMVELNQSSAEILKLCDGSRPFHEMVSKLEELFSTTDLREDVQEFLEVALHHGWIKHLSHQ